MTDKQNNFVRKHPRGSSGLEATESNPDSSVTAPGGRRGIRSNAFPVDASGPPMDGRVRKLRSMQGNREDSLRNSPAKESTPGENNTGFQRDHQPLHFSLPSSLWQDEGGESGEEI